MFNYCSHNVHQLTWKEINRIVLPQCSAILGIIDLLLSIPASSAQCERGFSHMKKIKSEYRSSLTMQCMNSLMLIKLHSSDIDEFDPAPAIHCWNTSNPRSRRPETATSVTSSKNEEMDADTSSDSSDSDNE